MLSGWWHNGRLGFYGPCVYYRETAESNHLSSIARQTLHLTSPIPRAPKRVNVQPRTAWLVLSSGAAALRLHSWKFCKRNKTEKILFWQHVQTTSPIPRAPKRVNFQPRTAWLVLSSGAALRLHSWKFCMRNKTGKILFWQCVHHPS